MMKAFGAVLALAAAVAAHGDHDDHQAPIAGPHHGLWYNTLPGDGGTQVRPTLSSRTVFRNPQLTLSIGRFSLFGHLHLRTPPIPPLPL